MVFSTEFPHSLGGRIEETEKNIFSTSSRQVTDGFFFKWLTMNMAVQAWNLSSCWVVEAGESRIWAMLQDPVSKHRYMRRRLVWGLGRLFSRQGACPAGTKAWVPFPASHTTGGCVFPALGKQMRKGQTFTPVLSKFSAGLEYWKPSLKKKIEI